MNKKFSTLLASVLFASAFSTGAFAAAGNVKDVVDGQNVSLLSSSKSVVIGTEGGLQQAFTDAAGKISSIQTANTDAKLRTAFTNLNRCLWKVEVVETSSTSGISKTYRFVNKNSGEYIAFDLKTNGEKTNATKMNQLGNNTWAVTDDGALYAYVPSSEAGKDSTYFLNSSFALVAVQGPIDKTTAPTGALKLTTEDLATAGKIEMNARIFNYVMNLPGHDGQLHFNNDKDVSSNETNILTGTNWEAIAYSASPASFALTNGEKVSGPNNKQDKKDGKVINIDKKKYLIVDTLYQDETARNYFKLAVDTIPYESYAVSGDLTNAGTFGDGGKGAVKRASNQAEFKGEYWFMSDSIALFAAYVPTVNTGSIFFNNAAVTTTAAAAPGTRVNGPAAGYVGLRQLGNGKVLTVAGQSAEPTAGWIKPLIQPYATAATGDAAIATDKLYFAQIKKTTNTDKYYAYNFLNNSVAVNASVSAYNSGDQWAVVPTGTTGAYRLVNRESGVAKYVGPVMKLKDGNDVVADTYVFGSDTLKLTAIDYSIATVEGDEDYTSYFYAGKDNDKVLRTFKITAASPFLSQLFMQAKSDSSVVLGETGVVWTFETVKDSKASYGAVLDGFKKLYRTQYNIALTDADGVKYYLVANGNVYTITKSDSGKKGAFYLKAIDKDQYVIYETNTKLTINPTPAEPIIEASGLASEKNDLFLVEQTNLGVYRELGVSVEDGLAEKAINVAKIYMDNEPNRFLYENTQNIVANNGNKVAKDSLNFLGIYNAAALVKNAALYVDTAYVNRKDNLMPQYMLALGVKEVEANGVIPCTENGNHFDAEGNKTDAAHCVHATPATKAYKTGRYLVSVKDSVPAGSKTYPGVYDGSIRLAFVEATHIGDSLIIKDSKYTGTKNAKNDTLKIADQELNKATFAMLIKDQETKSFYLETEDKTYVRILNGVPVLTGDIENAAIFNIAATDEEATANEAIEAAGVQVIGGQGVVTVQGAAGKVITVANILGQTIANQVAASDNVTIAAPAGVVVVAVEGEATKVVVK